MTLIRITTWTLRAIGQPHLVKSYDLKNAFGSGELDDLAEALTERAREGVPDNEIEHYLAALAQRRNEAVVIMPTADGPAAVKIGSGGTMGDYNEPEAFMANFLPCHPDVDS